MNAVWNSYGQLCGCPEIFKKSCKFFCRELDIRVSEVVKAHPAQAVTLQEFWECRGQIIGPHPLAQLVHKYKSIIFVIVTVAAY